MVGIKLIHVSERAPRNLGRITVSRSCLARGKSYHFCINLMSNFETLPNTGWTIHLSAQGLYSLSGKTSYRKISWSLEAARFGFNLFQSRWNLAGTSAALLPRCLSNFRAIRPLQHPISRLRDFTRFGGKTSYRLVNRGPGPSPDFSCGLHWWIKIILFSIFIQTNTQFLKPLPSR